MPIYHKIRLAKIDFNREAVVAYRLCRAKGRAEQRVGEVIEDEEDISVKESATSKWAELAKLGP